MKNCVHSSLRVLVMWIAVGGLAGCTFDLRKWQGESSSTAPITPSLSITGPGLTAGTNLTDFIYTVNYAAAANVTLADADIVLVGADTAGCVAVVTGAGVTARTVTVSGCTGDGPVSISIVANSATDSAGNQALAYGPSSSATVQNSFIVRFDTTKLSAGSSANNQVKLPLTYWSGYNFTVDWGDGQSETITSGTWNPGMPAITHTYASPGVYDLKFKGALPAFVFSDSADDKLKILDVKQWGTIVWDDMELMFSGCENVQISATDAPNLSGITSLVAMFSGAIKFNGAIGHWNTSTITNMQSIFLDAKLFNQPLGNWDVSHVTDARYMFGGAEAFNQNISTWNTSSMTDISGMFSYTLAFNQPINANGANWNTSNVTAMAGVFMGAEAFNQDIKDWNLSSVTTIDSIFLNAFAYNQNLSTWMVPNTVSRTTYDDGASSWAPGNKPTFLP